MDFSPPDQLLPRENKSNLVICNSFVMLGVVVLALSITLLLYILAYQRLGDPFHRELKQPTTPTNSNKDSSSNKAAEKRSPPSHSLSVAPQRCTYDGTTSSTTTVHTERKPNGNTEHSVVPRRVPLTASTHNPSRERPSSVPNALTVFSASNCTTSLPKSPPPFEQYFTPSQSRHTWTTAVDHSDSIPSNEPRATRTVAVPRVERKKRDKI